MNTTNKIITLAIGVMIAIIATNPLSAAAHTPNFLPYGEVGQEDQAYFWHDGVLYINAVPSQGNGLFIAETDIDQDYTIDQAIDRFGIDEDSHSFVVEPSELSDVGLVFMFNDETLNFELIGAIEA